MNRRNLANVPSKHTIPCQPAPNQQIPYNSPFMHAMVGAQCTYPNIPAYPSSQSQLFAAAAIAPHDQHIPPAPYVPHRNAANLRYRHTRSNSNNYQHQRPHSHSFTATFSAHNAADSKLQYQYDLLVFMQQSNQHQVISRDTYISAVILSLWCILNMFLYGCTAELLFFIITILIIHKDLILCNGQSCLPVLLLFNFTVRMAVEQIIEFIIQCLSTHRVVLTGYGLNIAVILVALLLSSQRFIFNVFGSDEIYLNLMRCRLFYRGKYIRWCSFAIYCWFCSLMIIQLMDNVCIKNLQFFGMWRNITVIPCDMVMIGYGVFVIYIWGSFKKHRHPHVHAFNPYLAVRRYSIVEIFVFLLIFVATFGFHESWLTQILVKNLNVTVVIVLLINFVMRDS